MNLVMVIPVVVALVGGCVATTVRRLLRPDLAALALTVVAGLIGLAIVWWTAMAAFGYVVAIPGVARVSGWCRTVLPGHDRIPAPVGMAALVTLVPMAVAIQRTRRRLRPPGSPPQPPYGIQFLACEEPIAYAVPGAQGYVVVSAGMLRCLDPAERRVLFAHEQAHLDLRHDRYLRISAMAAAAVPLLRPLHNQVRYATERWADEVAASAVGDRRLVARALARAALARTTFTDRDMALIGLGVRDRVEALLGDPPPQQGLTGAALGAIAVAVSASLAGSVIQFHHLLTYVLHVCPT